jgi:hypothetical protein
VHVPISDAPRRPRGHRYAGSRTDEQVARRTPRSVRLALTRATETALMPRLAAPRVTDRPRLIGWSSLDLVRANL